MDKHSGKVKFSMVFSKAVLQSVSETPKGLFAVVALPRISR